MTEAMKFYEIGRGKYAQQMQDAFLKAHREAFQTGEKITIASKIVIDPPDARNPEFGNLSWEVDLRLPKTVSIKHITRLTGGLPISDGVDMAEALQTELILSGPEVVPGE